MCWLRRPQTSDNIFYSEPAPTAECADCGSGPDPADDLEPLLDDDEIVLGVAWDGDIYWLVTSGGRKIGCGPDGWCGVTVGPALSSTPAPEVEAEPEIDSEPEGDPWDTGSMGQAELVMGESPVMLSEP